MSQRSRQQVPRRKGHDAACFSRQYHRDLEHPTVMDVLRDHLPAVIAATSGPALRYAKLRVLVSLDQCREPGNGSHRWHCDGCGNAQISYNSCHNRHCPSCRKERRDVWMERILGWALPVEYLHCVFTLPHEFIPLILANDEAIYRLLLASVSKTLSDVTRSKFGARIGIVMVPHTWGQKMNLHLHVHAIVTCGGLALDDSQWKTFAAQDWGTGGDFSREALAAHYRDEFLKGLRRLFRKGELTMPPRMATVVTPADLERWLAPVLRKSWCVDVQGAPPKYRGPDAILNYLAGYVVGTAIRDRRILRYDCHCVVIGWKNYRTGKFEELPMTGEVFVRRFADHILPPRFVRIRYAGLFCARYRKGWLARCHELLGTTTASGATASEEADEEASPPEPQLGDEEPPEPQPRYRPTCGRCGQPEMTSQGNLTAQETAYHISWLRLFCDRLFTWLTTMDIDRSTIGLTSQSLDCVPDFTVLSYRTTRDHDLARDLPLPHS